MSEILIIIKAFWSCFFYAHFVAKRVKSLSIKALRESGQEKLFLKNNNSPAIRQFHFL